MFSTDEEQLKDSIEHEMDVLQFLDLLGMSFRDVIEMCFEQGLTSEQEDALERGLR